MSSIVGETLLSGDEIIKIMLRISRLWPRKGILISFRYSEGV